MVQQLIHGITHKHKLAKHLHVLHLRQDTGKKKREVVPSCAKHIKHQPPLQPFGHGYGRMVQCILGSPILACKHINGGISIKRSFPGTVFFVSVWIERDNTEAARY